MRVPRLRVLEVSIGFLCYSGLLSAQQGPDLREVMARLDRLESQNRELIEEIRQLRQQLLPPSTPTRPTAAVAPVDGVLAGAGVLAGSEEQAEIRDRRIAELDQTKVSTDHRLPITLTGTVLFNAFLNGKGAGGEDYPTRASNTVSQASGGATMRQTILGLKFDGPRIPGAGKVTGAVYMDFFGGGTGLNQLFRLRTANIDAAWRNTTVTFAFDKPLIAMRDPDSLAQVGVSPLTGAGNLWLWRPQVKVEQRIGLGSASGLRGQFALYQTNEEGTGTAADYGSTLAVSRPGYQGRLEFFRQIGDTRRIEIAPGFHASSTRLLGRSVTSRIFAIDWLIRPASRVDFTGTFFHGENVGVIGGLRQGVTVYRDQFPYSVPSVGGWAQVKVRVTPRLSFHAFGGQQDDRNADLDQSRGRIEKNQIYGANFMYRLGSNVMTAIEATQTRTSYLGSGTRINPHYDVALAYFF